MKIFNHSSSMLIALLAGLMSCSGNQSARSGATQVAGERPLQPLDVSLRAIVIKGELEARTSSDAWQDVSLASEIMGVAELRAMGKGAIVGLGQGRDAMWLRGGTHVRLASAHKGVLVDVLSGQVRFRSDALDTYAKTHYATVEVTGRDVLLVRRAAEGEVALAYTSQEPGRAAWAVALEGETAPSGIGVIEVASPAGERERRPDVFLELRGLDIRVTSAGDYTLTEVEHVFYNPSEGELEGTFRFPLPDHAMPLGLAMEINGRMMEGEIVEREKARKTYESIVESMQDPALLEWEEGNRFQLRVFPIEPRQEKRVVLRYAAPLTPSIDGWEYVYATAAPELQAAIPRFKLSFDGKIIVDRRDFLAGEDVVVPVAGKSVPRVVQEVLASPQGNPQGTTDGTYTAVRIAPDWARIGGDEVQAREPARQVVVIMDTSRSALEARDLSLETLEILLGELGAEDRFVVLAADIETRPHATELVKKSPDSIRAAMEFVRAIDFDGASDLGAAFARAAELGSQAARAGQMLEIIYLGDGTPTWGITDTQALAEHVQARLGNARVHAALLGKGASTTQWKRIAGKASGRVATPRTAMDAKGFAFLVARSATTPRIDGLEIAGLDGHTRAFPAHPITLYRGDEVVALMRTEPGVAPPQEITLKGSYAGKPFAQTVRVFQPAPARLVAQRWAALEINELEASGADKDAIVALSKGFGVMSKHTSILVLESEEAYRQHGIERQQRLAQNAPQVTGGDLESVSARDASLSPDQIQPGDPEVRIPAPRDARAVVVIFPFGDTKVATFDEEANAWIARFLIDKDTPDGQYMVLVKVTLASGAIESYRLPYYVDTKAPSVSIEMKKTRNGGFVITARQVVTQVEMTALGFDQNSMTERKAEILADARRVELTLPSGKVLAMAQKAPGLFKRSWKPEAALTQPVTIRVVVTDEALNQSAFDMIVHPDGKVEMATQERNR